VVISGIVIASKPEDLSLTSEAVAAFSWAEVHYTEPTGRIVATIEADDIDSSMNRLEELQAIPSVLSASLAEYCLDELKGNEEQDNEQSQ
jgi:nitrate reductase NapAB chaperone NapD